VELSRQFSVFGVSNSLRYLSVGQGGSSPPKAKQLSDTHMLPETSRPPQFYVEFDPPISPTALALIDEEETEESSLFRLLFEHVFNDETKQRGPVLRARWSRKLLRLTWRVKIVFPGDPPYVPPPYVIYIYWMG
jgi:hypothetical protein